MFLKGRREVSLIIKPHGVSHLRDVDVALNKKLGSLLQSQVADKLGRRYACYLLHLTVQLGAADAHFLGQHLYIEVGILYILVHALHDTLHQGIVVALHLYPFYLVRLPLCAREFAP